MSRESGTGFCAGLAVGVMIRLAIGFLYAPRPGAETRHIAKEKISFFRRNCQKDGWKG